MELDAQSNPQTFTLESFNALSHSKVVPQIITIAALVEATNQPEIFPSIELSIKHAIAGGQLHDDVGDWQEDFETGHMTYFLSQLGTNEIWESASGPSIEQLHRRIDEDWKDVDGFQKVIDRFNLALVTVENIECSAWVEYINGYKRRVEINLRHVLHKHTKDIFQKIVAGSKG
jgi:hypothetical protein